MADGVIGQLEKLGVSPDYLPSPTRTRITLTGSMP